MLGFLKQLFGDSDVSFGSVQAPVPGRSSSIHPISLVAQPTIVERALADWDPKDKEGVLWLRYYDVDVADKTVTAMRQVYGFSDVQIVGAVVMVGGRDARACAKVLKELLQRRHLFGHTFHFLRSALRRQSALEPNIVIYVPYHTKQEAFLVKRDVKDLYFISVEMDYDRLAFSVDEARRFIHRYREMFEEESKVAAE